MRSRSAVAVATAFAAAATLIPFSERAASAQSADAADLCAKRAPCAVEKTLPAGTDSQGRALAVVLINLGKPKPDAEGDGPVCRVDGRQEYWLRIAGVAQAQKLFEFCNDGYGAAGVGQDALKVESNRLIHHRVGGSAWRWEYTNVYSLAPFRHVSNSGCSYHTLTPGYWVTDWNWARFSGTGRWQPAPKDDAKGDVEMGCTDKGRYTYTPVPRVAVVTGLRPNAAAALGSCSALIDDGARGHVIFGRRTPQNPASLRALLVGTGDLIVTVAAKEFDTGATNWVHTDHVEVWLGSAPQSIQADMAGKPLRQWGVGLDGKIHPRPGDTGPRLALVARSQDVAAGQKRVTLRLRLPAAGADEPPPGLAVVLSRAIGGKQVGMIATSMVRGNDRSSLGAAFDVSVKKAQCGVRNGVIDVVETGKVDPDEE